MLCTPSLLSVEPDGRMFYYRCSRCQQGFASSQPRADVIRRQCPVMRHWVCPKCDTQFELLDGMATIPVPHSCRPTPGRVLPRAGIVRDLKRMLNFTRQGIAHLMSRTPTCTQAQIDARASVCEGCEFFNWRERTCDHIDCGCSMTPDKKFLSALAWADKQCPLGRWPT